MFHFFFLQNFAYNTQETYCFGTSCYFGIYMYQQFPRFEITCERKPKITIRYSLKRTSSETHAFFSGFIRARLQVDFDPCCLFRFVVVIIDN